METFWLRLVGATGGTVLAAWVWAFMTGKIVARWQFDKLEQDRDKWQQTALQDWRLVAAATERALAVVESKTPPAPPTIPPYQEPLTAPTPPGPD